MTASPVTYTAPRGMRDAYPEDMAVRNHLFAAWCAAAEHHGFLAYDAPVVESLELLTRKAGEEIVNQIYAFKDKSGRALALRPELTPSLARMVAARQGELTFPLKWYAVAQCFRYERMTRGRKREHYQWNLDVIGEPGVSAEVEVLATAIDGMKRAGLQTGEFLVHYSSRRLLAELLEALDIPPVAHAATFLVLDKHGKLPDTELNAMLGEAGLQPRQIEAVWRLLAIDTLDAALAHVPAQSPAREELTRFESMLADYGIGANVFFDMAVVRGLAYYTGIVFEAFDRERRFRALFGGGRYDNLLATVGGRPETGVGLGFGDVVIGELLAGLGRLPAGGGGAEIAVGYLSDAERGAAMRLAASLRASGRSVDLALHSEKAKVFFGRVGKRTFREAVYMGPDDVASGQARIKNLATREEALIPLA